jgi:hypothetical protein
MISEWLEATKSRNVKVNRNFILHTSFKINLRESDFFPFITTSLIKSLYLSCQVLSKFLVKQSKKEKTKPEIKNFYVDAEDDGSF